MKMIKLFILYCFVRLFEKELENTEPEVDRFIAKLIKPYIKNDNKKS